MPLKKKQNPNKIMHDHHSILIVHSIACSTNSAAAFAFVFTAVGVAAAAAVAVAAAIAAVADIGITWNVL
jgi:hypothetical protein